MKHLRCLIEAPGGAKKEHPKANFFSLGNYPLQPSFKLLPIARFKNQFDRYVATLEPLKLFTDIFKPNVRNVNGKSLAEASNDYRTLVRNNQRDSQNYRLFEPFYKPPC